MTITNDSLNLLYGYGTLTYYGLMDYEYSVSISYMGMEPEVILCLHLLKKKVSISYMGMELEI